MTGLEARQIAKNFWCGLVTWAVIAAKSLPGSQRPSVFIASSQWWKPPPKSYPPENARPAPRSTMTLTAGSRSASPMAASISSGIGGTMVLSCSGRFSVMVATDPSVL